MQLLDLLAIIGAGFTIVGALILLSAYLLFLPQMEKSPQSRLACAMVLLGLVALQLAHLYELIGQFDLLATRAYVALLMGLPLAFYLFSLYVLFPNAPKHWLMVLHLAPFVASFFLPVTLVPSIAFALGTAYTLWLLMRLVRLRAERAQFGLKIFFFAMFSLMAVIALVLGLTLPQISPDLFFPVYSLCISVAMASVVALLIINPSVLVDVITITDRAYSESKLAGVDTRAKLEDVRRLMQQEKLYEDASLDLAMVAERVGLSAHQLSELVNRHAGNNFPGFVKAYRLEAAKALLKEEPDSSILAISIQTGFKSQSAFYTAFKDATGMSPGVYRKSCSAKQV